MKRALFISLFLLAIQLVQAQVFTPATGISVLPSSPSAGQSAALRISGWDFVYAEPFFWTGSNWASAGSFIGSVSQTGWVTIPQGASVSFIIPAVQDLVYAVFACDGDTDPLIYHCNGDVVLDASGHVVSNNAKWMAYHVVPGSASSTAGTSPTNPQTTNQPTTNPSTSTVPAVVPMVNTGAMMAAQIQVAGLSSPWVIKNAYFCNQGEVACGVASAPLRLTLSGTPSGAYTSFGGLMCCPVTGFTVDKEVAAIGLSPSNDVFCPSNSAVCGSGGVRGKVSMTRCCAVNGASVDVSTKSVLAPAPGVLTKPVTTVSCAAGEVVCGVKTDVNSYATDAYCCKIK